MAWPDVHLISSGPYDYLYGKPAIVREIAGRLHAIWHDDSEKHIYYSYSFDDGLTWAARETVEENLDPAEPVQACSLAVDSSGTVHAIYQGMGWGTFPAKNDLYYKWRNPPPGGAWSARTALTDNNVGDGFLGSIAVDSQDNVHVIWWKGGNLLQYIKKTAGGGLERYSGRWCGRPWGLSESPFHH